MKAFKSVKHLLKLIFRVSPSFIFITIFGSLFSATQIIGNVILPKYLIDSLIIDKNLEAALIWGGVIVGFNLLINFINKTYKRILDVKNLHVSYLVMKEMSNKIMNVEYKHLEDPYYLDLKERAIFACTNQGSLQRLVSGISGIVTNTITLISLTVIIISLGYVLLFILLIGIVITLFINRIFMKFQLQAFKSIIPINRRYNYYLGLTENEKLSKDMRLYKMNPLIMKRVREYNNENFMFFKKLFNYGGLSSGLNKVINAIQTGFIYLFISWKIFFDTVKQITIGDFTMFANASINFTNSFNNLFSDIIDMGQVIGYLEPFVEFMQLPDVIKQTSPLKLNEVETIEFKNVTFTYPKTNSLILDDVSFSINRGNKISIVGLNGAGKTTIIKLLCRFYEPDSGHILINGHSIYEYDYKSYLDTMAVVFQDYRIFSFSILDNISSDKNIDENRINEIIDEVGLKEKIDELSLGINTRLNKNLDDNGVELSGGQNQKIAISRALYKDASLVILDEPTSALDPLAEAEIYQNFNDLVKKKTAIYISHRMSSSVFCDYVLVLDGGKVVSFDSHKNLMKKTDSLYYKLFTSQAKNYQLSNETSLIN